MYFRSEVILKELWKILPSVASWGISGERLKLTSLNFTSLSRTTGPTNMPEITSPAASGWHSSRFEELRKISHPTALFPSSIKQCQRRLKISGVRDIGNVLD